MGKILGIDLGNYNIKTSTGMIFKATYSTDESNDVMSADEVIEYKGQKYFISKGGFDTELNKADKNTIPLYLYALAKSTDVDLVDVVMGLPIDQFKSNKDAVEKKFKGQFEFKINGKLRNITVKRVKVFPEGIGAFYSLDDIAEDDFILVDIGGRTTNIALFVDGEHSKSNSIALGAFNMLTNFKNAMNPKHNLSLSIEDSERHIRKNELKVNGKEVDLSIISELKNVYVEELMKVLKLEYPVSTFKIILTGGGSKLFYDKMNELPYEVGQTEDFIFANAVGFERVGEMLWQNK